MKETLHIIQNKTKPLQSTLIISFSGGAIRIGGFTRFELRRTLKLLKIKNNHAFDMLFLLDPTGLSWYIYDSQGTFNGWQEVGKTLQSITKNYKNVIMLGFCMGATGALMSMQYIISKTDCNCIGMIVNPQTDPMSHLNTKYKRGAQLLPLEKRCFLKELQSVIESCDSDFATERVIKLCVHCSDV